MKKATSGQVSSLTLRRILTRSLVLALGALLFASTRHAVPDFPAMENVPEKKSAFFAFVAPMAIQVNKELARDREFFLQAEARIRGGESLGFIETTKLEKLAETFGVELADPIADDALATLKRRIDIIPPSLTLAQAATESGWGTSRFARESNNFFGIACFTEGCGSVPSARNEGSTREVEEFTSAAASVERYAELLNTRDAYREMRTIRAATRQRNAEPSGTTMASGLALYSQKGKSYVEGIKRVIERDELHRYDDPATWAE
jgi:Bax protein